MIVSVGRKWFDKFPRPRISLKPVANGSSRFRVISLSRTPTRERLTKHHVSSPPLIRYSDHAQKRMVERSISTKDIETAIGSPLEVIPVRYGRHAVYNLLPGERFLVVIYEQEEEDFIVVTAVKTNKEGARRVGFTRI